MQHNQHMTDRMNQLSLHPHESPSLRCSLMLDSDYVCACLSLLALFACLCCSMIPPTVERESVKQLLAFDAVAEAEKAL